MKKTNVKLTTNCQSKNMKVSRTVERIELVELSKLIKRNKTPDIPAYDVAVIEETLQIEGSLKATTRMLAIGKYSMYALRDEQENITYNLDEIIK